MARRAPFSSFGTLLLLPALAAPAALGQTVADLEDVRVVGHHFTSRIGSRSRQIQVRDAAKARYVVLRVAARLPNGEGKLFTNDFMLRYAHGSVGEDRTECTVLARADGEAPVDVGNPVIGNASWIMIEAGDVHFALACLVEHDVRDVALYRLGVRDPVSYTIGSDRPYSVYVTTDAGPEQLAQVAAVLRSGGYQVITSDQLRASGSGITVHYAQRAETQAREISRRLMTVLDVAPTVKTIKLVSKYDVVVWLKK